MSKRLKCIYKDDVPYCRQLSCVCLSLPSLIFILCSYSSLFLHSYLYLFSYILTYISFPTFFVTSFFLHFYLYLFSYILTYISFLLSPFSIFPLLSSFYTYFLSTFSPPPSPSLIPSSRRGFINFPIFRFASLINLYIFILNIKYYIYIIHLFLLIQKYVIVSYLAFFYYKEFFISLSF